MIDLIKKLFERRNEKVTLVLLDEKRPDSLQSYLMRPYSIIKYIIAINIILLLFASVLMYITPIGNMIFNKSDREIRRSVIDISHRLMALQDSLNLRDQHLSTMKAVFAEGSDTVFTVNFSEDYMEELLYESLPINFLSEPATALFQRLESNQIIYSRNLKMVPDFPTEPPIEGTVTRLFDAKRNHFGVDIASEEGAHAKVIADGVVINADWTVNYGFVVHVQHGNGYMSTYKHLSDISKKKGDIIFKGDILGTVGKSGVLTSGPHIHFELWRNGIALNPFNHVTKLTEVN